MKILMINASPHKGNTWRVMKKAKKEILKVNPKVQFEEVHINELNLPFCTGCSLCFRKGRELCPHYSIIKEVYSKMEESEGLIFGTTTFNMAPNALAKNFLDHFCFCMHRPHFFKNKALVVSTTGGVFADKTVKYTAGTLAAIGYNRCYKLPVSSYSWNDFQLEKVENKIRKETLKFYQDLSSGRLYAPSAGLMIPYNLFRGMSLGYVKGTEYETEDGNYWTEPVRAKYTYDSAIKIPLYKKIIGTVFYQIGKLSAKHITVTYKK